MQFLDFSPPALPSLDQQCDALKKGLGRTVQWAAAERLAHDLLLDACLHDKRHDSQVDGNRGDWLWTIMNSVGAIERFRGPILANLRKAASEGDVEQLCQLALRYAEMGDREFTRTLYEIVEHKPVAYCPWVGEGQLLNVGGEEAFLFIARVRGQLLESQQWDWDDEAVVDRAIEMLGESRVEGLLNGSTDPPIRRFEMEWRKSASAKEAGLQSHKNERRSVSVDEILAAAERDARHPGFFRGWGVYADEIDQETVLKHLWQARDPQVIVNLLWVFHDRPLPRFDPRLIELARHGDEKVRLRAIHALKNNKHPLVRGFALQAIEEHARLPSVVRLFARNFMAGDERRLLDFVDLPNEDWDRHGVLMDVLRILDDNPNADCVQLAIIAYAQTPREMCRLRAVRLLMARGSAPEWMIDECRHDANEDCREFLQQAPSNGE